MLSSLKEKVILITGSSSGIGKALAKRLSVEEAKLILLSRTADKLQDIAHELSHEGHSISCFSCNVVDIMQIQNAVEYVLEAYGTIDILINCATIWNEGLPEYYTEAKVRELFDVNAIGAISMIQEVLPTMRQRRCGQILNIISTAGVNSYETSAVYSATKFAVRGFTESLAKDVRGSGVKVIGLYPGENMDAELFNTNTLMRDNHEYTSSPDIAEIAAFVLKQPGNLNVEHLEVGKIP
jgi:NADP-dependent 3-hydroxy acid dehydrogenase YdfG